LQVAGGSTFDGSGIADLAEEAVSGGESFVETVSSGRIGIRSTAGEVHTGLGDFHESLGKFVTLLLDDAEIAQSTKETLLGLVFGVFEGGDTETFQKATKLLVAIFEFTSLLVRCGGRLGQGIVFVLRGRCVRFELLNLLSRHGERGVKFAKLEIHVVLTTHDAAHCEEQCKGVSCWGGERHEGERVGE
jgi:hypothetical protein